MASMDRAWLVSSSACMGACIRAEVVLRCLVAGVLARLEVVRTLFRWTALMNNDGIASR